MMPLCDKSDIVSNDKRKLPGTFMNQVNVNYCTNLYYRPCYFKFIYNIL